MKGKFCPYREKPLFCQEKECSECNIYEEHMAKWDEFYDKYLNFTEGSKLEEVRE